MTKTTVTDLSKIAVCEKQYVLSKTYGQVQNEKMVQGTQKHLKFEHSSWRQWERKLSGEKRCYIATHLWGELDPRVIFLRNYRDTVLLKNKWGILLVRFYYWLSPKLLKIKVFSSSWSKKIIAGILEKLIKCLST